MCTNAPPSRTQPSPPTFDNNTHSPAHAFTFTPKQTIRPRFILVDASGSERERLGRCVFVCLFWFRCGCLQHSRWGHPCSPMTHGENVWNALLHGRCVCGCIDISRSTVHIINSCQHRCSAHVSSCLTVSTWNVRRPLWTMLVVHWVVRTLSSPIAFRRRSLQLRQSAQHSWSDGERLRDNDNTAQTLRTMISDVEGRKHRKKKPLNRKPWSCTTGDQKPVRRSGLWYKHTTSHHQDRMGQRDAHDSLM